MNNLLELKGEFQHKSNQARGGSISLKKGQVVKADHLLELANDLQKIADYWSVHPEIEGALVSAHYVRIVPKSSRLQFLLSCTNNSPNDFIVGAKFETTVDIIDPESHAHHVFTYFIPLTVRSCGAEEKITNADDEERERKGALCHEPDTGHGGGQKSARL